MDAADRSRRSWILTLRRFAELAWTRHGVTRYVSLAVVPMVVALATPGYWWLLCAAFTAVGALVDHAVHRAFDRSKRDLDSMSGSELKALADREIHGIAIITGLYAAPYTALAFAPGLGPFLGLMFCAGAAVVCATLHVMTRTMVFYTLPVIAIGLVTNAYVIVGGGTHGLLSATLALLTAANVASAARGGESSFSALIAARLEAELAAEALERRVAERTAALDIAVRKANDANRAKSEFLANMSHELRTPLNAVIGYAEIVEEDLASGDTAESAADLARVRSAAKHLLTLINEVLDFSRIEAGRLELRKGPCDLQTLLREALDTVRPVADRNGTTCSMRTAPTAPAIIEADETRLRQCVLNLLSNAAKFTRDGVVEVELRNCRIDGAPGVAIAVRDTGRGIAADDLKDLFQPFKQVDGSATRVHDGAGLGLVITRRLARAMGGDVIAKSEAGQGSVFTLYVPVGTAAAKAA